MNKNFTTKYQKQDEEEMRLLSSIEQLWKVDVLRSTPGGIDGLCNKAYIVELWGSGDTMR
ncbi:hypothetical protein T03_5785 [Trichinella britovi]|uniref:Uncharacterized protein n=1 Tax=Trichinella britovi TaxID=45882 RepID=A0A0V1D7T8_TRIBR|nr:hypothetical protein T03_5785 [Trichinella britovi]KRZ86213.1 hypothetical protein T08_7952 [Trichinella sp. T8]